jgi:uncharacterized membrane protein HdeD (DUF308 family)
MLNNSRTNVSGTPNGESPRDKVAAQLFNEGSRAIERRQIMVRTPILHEIEDLRRQWGWLLALGIGMVVLGAVAFSVTPAATLAAVLLLGWLLVISGLVEAIHAFRVRRWAGTFLHLIVGILGIFVGLLVVTHPVAGALAWTLMFASFFIAVGIFRLATAVWYKLPHWGWAAFDGVITFVLGVMLLLEWPWSGVWFLGLTLGISLMLRGWSYVMFADAIRRLPISSEATPAL